MPGNKEVEEVEEVEEELVEIKVKITTDKTCFIFNRLQPKGSVITIDEKIFSKSCMEKIIDKPKGKNK